MKAILGIMEQHYWSFGEAGLVSVICHYAALSTAPPPPAKQEIFGCELNDADIDGCQCENYAKTLDWAEGAPLSSPRLFRNRPCIDSLLMYFNSDDSLRDYVRDSDYGKGGYRIAAKDSEDGALRPIGTAVVFEVSDDGKTWNYKIRSNSTKVPPTDGDAIDEFMRNPPDLYEYNGLQGYAEDSSFVYLQNWIDFAISTYVGRLNGLDEDEINAWTWELQRGKYPPLPPLLLTPSPRTLQRRLVHVPYGRV
ncbi:MAG: hypothetical protein GY950_33965 [bacterium]|nr:hypothetical protein [bacterium]